MHTLTYTLLFPTNINRRRDLGLHAMQYGDVYVASVSLLADRAQCARALREADAFPGPSVIIAHAPAPEAAPCTDDRRARKPKRRSVTSHRRRAPARCARRAIESGRWPLYRWLVKPCVYCI